MDSEEIKAQQDSLNQRFQNFDELQQLEKDSLLKTPIP